MTQNFSKFFRDKQGKIVIWQTPNVLLWLWLGLKISSLLTDNQHFKTNAGNFSGAVLFAWAYLEITSGESIFRRILGIIVLGLTVINFFT